MVGIITDNKYNGMSAVNLGSSLYRFGVLNSSGDVILPTVLGQSISGVITSSKTGTAMPCEMQITQCVPCVAGGTVAIGDEIVTGTTGLGLAKTLAGQFVAGIAFSAATVGQVFLLWLAGPAGGAGIGVTQYLTLGYSLISLAINGNRATSFPFTFAGRIRSWFALTTTAGTGAGANVDLNLEIDTVDVTGGVLTLTLANQGTIGAIVQATAITAGNTFAAGSVLDIEATNSTAFTAGNATLVLVLD